DAVNGVSPRRDGNRDRVAVPHGCYPCLDGRWVVISCWDDAEWERLASALEGTAGTSLAEDARLATVAGRRSRETELDEAIADWTRGRDADEVADAMCRARVHASPVNTMRDLYADPQLTARRTWQAHDHPDLGPLRYRMVSYQLSETPGSVRSAAPRLGEHNA